MSYNTNTRLLLQFDATPYAQDTSTHNRACTLLNNSGNQAIYTNDSPHGSGTGNCLYCGGAAGTYDSIYVDSPANLFANPSESLKLFSLWYSVDSDHADSASGLFNYSASDNSFRIYTESDGRITIVGTNGGTFVAQSAALASNLYGTGWHHLYIFINGTNILAGLDGTQVINYTHTSDIWGTGATVYNISFGQGQSYWAHKGRLDSIQVLENDLTWYGGGYTVPGKPLNPGEVPLTGQSFSFSSGSLSPSTSSNVPVSGQVLSFSTPKLKATVSPTTKKLWSRQPTKRFRADFLNPLTGDRTGAFEIAREFWEAAPTSSNVTVALSGQSYSYAQGALSAQVTGPVSVALTGQSFAFAQGAPTTSRTVSVSGQAYSYSLGTAATNRSVALSGQSFSYQQGTILAGVDKFVSITGQSFSFSQGSVTASQAATYNSNTRLQYRFNEANGSTTTDDSSIYNHDTQTWSGPYQISTSVSKFGSGSLAMGNPTGTKTAGDVIISSPAGIFSTSTSSAKRFDFWFRHVGGAATTNCMLFHLKLQNGDTIGINANRTEFTAFYGEAYGGVTTSALGTFTNPWPYSGWHHFRVLVYGNTLTIAVDGAQVAQVVRSGGTDIWRASDISAFTIGNWDEGSPYHDDLSYAAFGYMDSLVITEGDASWTGGAYAVPTAEPEDPPSGGGITGDSANTIDDVTSAGTGILGRMASGENTTGEITSDGIGVLEKFMVGGSTVADVTTEGVLALGTVLYANGANTLDTIESVGTAIMQPTRFLVGANTTDHVASTGAGYIWANLRGANTTDAVTSTGTGNNIAASQDLLGVGANTTGAVTSTGSGELAIVGVGANSTAAVTSVGDMFSGSFGSGANTLDPITTSGTILGPARVAQGANTTGQVTSTGSGGISITGEGGSVITSILSSGSAALLIQGVGGNTVNDVRTYFQDGYFDSVELAFVKTKTDTAWVRR